MTNRKEYEILMSIKAALGTGFNTTFDSANKTVKKLQDALQNIKSVQKDVSAYDKAKTAIERLKNEKEKLINAEGDNTAAIEKINVKINEEKTKLSELSDKLKAANIDTENLSDETKRLSDEYDKLKEKQEKLSTLDKWQKENSAALKEAQTDLLKTTAVIAAAGTAFYKGAIEPAIEFESAFAGVKKTVDATPAELREIENEIREIAKTVPATTTEIAAMAEAAGQLGINNENITAFSKIMIDLSESTNLSASDAADNLARFANITGMSQREFSNLGSTIVSLGNNFATTESEIVEMAMRLAGAGSQIGMSEAEIMGFATALSSVGIEAQAGGSAFSKTMTNMKLAAELGAGKASDVIQLTGKTLEELEWLAGTDAKGFKALAENMGYTSEEMKGFLKNKRNLEDFARVSGKTAEEFTELFSDNAAEAINSFIIGLSKMDEDGISAIATLDEMGFTEVRLRDTLLRATNANELFTDALDMANIAWDENTALANEAAQRYATTESQMKMLKNEFNELGISMGEIFLPMFKEFLGNIGDGVSGISDWVKENPELVKQIIEITAKVGLLIIILKAAKVAFYAVKGGGIQLIKTLKAIGPMGGIAAAAVIGLAVALELGKNAVKKFQDEYILPKLLNNGGQKLSEFTDSLMTSTAASYEHAQGINASREKIKEIRSEIDKACVDLDFYGANLRKNGILTPTEAAAMIEPFNALITSLQNDFTVKYSNVFDAFKLAATDVAVSLGADVSQISGILDGFKNKYNKNLSESQQVITVHLERVASGENLTAEDWEKYNKEMAYIRDTEAATSDAAREYAKIQENLNTLDFGVNTEEAMAELQRLAEYANKYRDELTNAQKTLDEDYSAFKRIADNDLSYGKIDKNQYKEVIDGLEAAQALTYQSYLDKYNEFQEDIAEISERAATQISFAKEGALNNVGGFEDWWASFQATWGTGLGLWGDRQEAYEQALFGDVYKMGEEVNNIITQTELEPYILNIALSDEAKALLGDLGINGFNYGGSYSATHIKKSGNAFKMNGRQRGYASGTSSAEQGLKLVGERGPEIIDFGGGERVYNAYETRRILNPVTTAPPSVSSTILNGGGITLKIENNPVIHTSDSTDNLDEVLRRNNEHLIVIVDKYLREKADNARRMDYD